MKHLVPVVLLLVLLLVLAGACSKTKIKECEALVATAEKIRKCDKLPAKDREQITEGVEQIRTALKLLEDVGDQAPKDQLEMLARTCKDENDQIRTMYEKVAPECLE